MNRNRSQSKYTPSHENPEEQLLKDLGDKMIESYDHEQLRCHYHPQKQITNFCEENNCNLPMCPSCVAIHSEFHKQNKHQGMFKTLDVIIGRIVNELQEQFRLVRQNKDIIRSYEESIEMGPDNLRTSLNDLKVQTIQAIEDVFEQMRLKLEHSLDDQLHSNDNQLNMVQVQLDQYNQTLLEIEEDMKQDPLPTIVKIKGEKTLERLRNQMPSPQPIVTQLTQNMIQVTPDGPTLYQNIQSYLDNMLQLKTSRETTRQHNVNQVPIAQGYLGQQSGTKTFQNGSPNRFQSGGQTIQRNHTPQKVTIDQQMYSQQVRQIHQLSSK